MDLEAGQNFLGVSCSAGMSVNSYQKSKVLSTIFETRFLKKSIEKEVVRTSTTVLSRKRRLLPLAGYKDQHKHGLVKMGGIC